MRGGLQWFMWVGWLGWDGGMVIIGHRSSKSTFGAQKAFDLCCLYFQFQYGLITRDSSTNFTVRNKFMPVRGVSPSQLFLGTFKVFSSYLLIRINIYSKLVAFLQFWTRSLFLKYWLWFFTLSEGWSRPPARSSWPGLHIDCPPRLWALSSF